MLRLIFRRGLGWTGPLHQTITSEQELENLLATRSSFFLAILKPQYQQSKLIATFNLLNYQPETLTITQPNWSPPNWSPPKSKPSDPKHPTDLHRWGPHRTEPTPTGHEGGPCRTQSPSGGPSLMCRGRKMCGEWMVMELMMVNDGWYVLIMVNQWLIMVNQWLISELFWLMNSY